MKRATIDTLFLAVILAILLLPDARVAVGLVPGKLLDEKRVPFQIPDLAARLERGDSTLAPDINRWFDDRYGLRDRLIRAKNEIDYRLFGTSQKVAIGRDGWLFLRGHSDFLVRYERGGAAWRADIESKLLTVADYLKARGITFIVLGIPDKSDVYPMERSSDMPVRPAVTQFDKLKADLASHPELVYIDATDILKPSPNGPPLYWKTDIHHTFEAARLIVGALVNKIAALEGRPPIAPRRRWTVQNYPIAGDLDNFMTRLSKIREDSFSYEN